jgi:uncharacterized protein (DUF2235 family)
MANNPESQTIPATGKQNQAPSSSAYAGKNIVICSDGTGQSSNDPNSSNVFQLCSLLDLTDPKKQIGGYDAGVGTVRDRKMVEEMKKEKEAEAKEELMIFGDDRPSLREKVWNLPILYIVNKTSGLLLGTGLQKNVMQMYEYLVKNYHDRPDGSDPDRIYLFGFIRGAFTVRALAGLLSRCGLLKEWDEDRFSEAWNLYEPHYETYENNPTELNKLKQQIATFRDTHSKEVRVHFLDIWDTVKSYGYLSPKSLPHMRHNDIVNVVRHALSINEHRKFFEPTSWGWRDLDVKQGCPGPSEKPEGQDIEEIWFSGDHSDVGGGHEDSNNHLAKISLKWMINEAASFGLHIDKEKYRTDLANLSPDKNNAQFKRHDKLKWKGENSTIGTIGWHISERVVPRRDLINCPLPPKREWTWKRPGRRELIEYLRFNKSRGKSVILIHESVNEFYSDDEKNALWGDISSNNIDFVKTVEHVVGLNLAKPKISAK